MTLSESFVERTGLHRRSFPGGDSEFGDETLSGSTVALAEEKSAKKSTSFCASSTVAHSRWNESLSDTASMNYKEAPVHAIQEGK